MVIAASEPPRLPTATFFRDHVTARTNSASGRPTRNWISRCQKDSDNLSLLCVKFNLETVTTNPYFFWIFTHCIKMTNSNCSIKACAKCLTTHLSMIRFNTISFPLQFFCSVGRIPAPICKPSS